MIIIASLIVFTGCGNAIPEMTEDQRAQVVEYSAMLLLKYDKNYQSSMLTQEELAKQQQKLEATAAMKAEVARQKELAEELAAQEEAEKENEESSSSSGEGDASVPVYTDIDEFLGIGGIDIEYDHFDVCDSYPAATDVNSWQGICYATPGNKLVVFTFNMTNNSGADMLLDIASIDQHISFKVDGRSKTALTTLLTDDFINYRDNIAAGETKQAVLIIEMSEDDAAAISSVTMKLKFNGETANKTLL